MPRGAGRRRWGMCWMKTTQIPAWSLFYFAILCTEVRTLILYTTVLTKYLSWLEFFTPVDVVVVAVYVVAASAAVVVYVAVVYVAVVVLIPNAICRDNESGSCAEQHYIQLQPAKAGEREMEKGRERGREWESWSAAAPRMLQAVQQTKSTRRWHCPEVTWKLCTREGTRAMCGCVCVGVCAGVCTHHSAAVS